jgi:CheY-like chemotaxis protein
MSQTLDIFVVDNDPIYQLVTKKLLVNTAVNINYKSFMDGKEALQAIMHNKMSNKIILLDLDMPIMDGWEFLDAYYHHNLYEECKDIIYIVTSSIAKEDRNKAKNYNRVKGYIEKPLNLDAINNLLQAS